MKIWLLLLCLVAPAWAQRWPDALVSALETQPVKKAQSLDSYLISQGRPSQGSSGLWLLELADGSKAVFRSESSPSRSQSEIAAYRVTRWLGLDLVPPSAVRTLHENEWPATVTWPFPTALRTGSLQLYVNVSPRRGPLKDPLDRADVEVVSFVMGRYNNPPGNLLQDEKGMLCVVGFENSLELQQARYGHFPYALRGHRRPDLTSLPAGQPFPFDKPQEIENPGLEEMRQTFSPWWGFQVEGLEDLLSEVRSLPDRKLRYAFWDNYLWVQVGSSFRHPAYTKVYRDRTMQRMAELDEATLQKLLPMPYSQEHVRGMLERARQVLAAWKP